MTTYREINFDGLVGPTHHYGGLSVDNFASDSNRAAVSNPQKAALQGLTKMKALHEMGYPQAVLPPLCRPVAETVEAMGFHGKTAVDSLYQALNTDPYILSAVASASSMWTANAATVAPSCDTEDGQLHLVTANLNSKLHRAIEAPETHQNLAKIFGSHRAFPAIPGGQAMGDEGAANHTRLVPEYGAKGLHVFVYGRSSKSDQIENQRFLGRQTLEASRAVARRLRLSERQTVFLQQSQEIIDAGVFHNDVIAVGNLDCYFSHEKAYTSGPAALEQLSSAFHTLTGSQLQHIIVPDQVISVERAVKTYLFNSQLIGSSGNMTLIAPIECQEDSVVSKYLTQICQDPDTAINQVHYFDLRESMKNGGGPACLRLRVVLSEQEIASLGARVMLDDTLHNDLYNWVKTHYRETLTVQDLATAEFYEEVQQAFSELREIMQLK